MMTSEQENISLLIMNETDHDVNYVYYPTPKDMLIPWVVNKFFFPIIITISIAFVIGVIGNIAVIWFMASDKVNQNVTSIFLVSLAISDLLLLTVYAPLEMTHYFIVDWDRDGSLCKLSKYAESVSGFASILNLLAVTLERFVVIVFPIQSRSICTLRNCKRLMFVVWILSLILAFPAFFCMEVTKTVFYNDDNEFVNYYKCGEVSSWEGQYWVIYRLVSLFVLPSIIMGACYTWVIVELWISTKTMLELTNNVTSNRTESKLSINQDNCSSPCNHKIILRSHVSQESRDVKSARQQVIKMLILVVVLFLLCWGSYLSFAVILKCCLLTFDRVIYTIRIVFFLLPFVHSCLNPVVYCFMSTKFRRKIIHSYGRFCAKGNVNQIDLASSKCDTSLNGHITSLYNLASFNTSFDTPISRSIHNAT